MARIWDALSGKELSSLSHGNLVSALAFSSDGRYLVTGSYDKTARVWDPFGAKKELARLQHGEYVWAVAFSPDARYVVTGTGSDPPASADTAARIWEWNGKGEAIRLG